MNLRRLNDEGLRQFAEYLVALKTTPALAPPVALLDDPATSEEAAPVAVWPMPFPNRLAAGRWLHDLLEHAALPDVARDKGVWAWLSLRLFDQVCPADGRGNRKPGEMARYIPDFSFRKYYRHLLAGPWRIVRAHRDQPERALVVLHNPVDTPGELAEQVMARQEIVTNRSAMAAATMLYIDPQTKRRVRGAATKSRGAARRLADFCNQLDVTWDLYAMEPGELLAKLPKEFQRFQPVA